MALEERWALPGVPEPGAGNVGIIGGGPAGLSAAYHLRRKGHAVTVFEANPELGGVLRYGIPPYRLPNEVLDAEIRRLLALGIDVHTDTRIGDAAEFASLRERFSAIFVATGAGRPKRLPQLDGSRPWVIEGADFLARTNRGERPECGRRVLVIGGGSAAMDVARTARRHGRDVTVLCLEKASQLPAQREEVVEAREEGVVIDDASMVRCVIDRGADGLLIECTRVELEAGAHPGQFAVDAVPGTDFRIEADTIVPAIGQDPDLAPFAGLQAEGGLIRVDERLNTSQPGVFAGGDVASMRRFVTVAFGFGKRAAIAIDGYLRTLRADRSSADDAPVPFDAINTHYHPPAARPPRRLLPAERRVRRFDAVELPLSDAEALSESQRCFSCGNCTFCDNCLTYCPDMVIRREGARYLVDGDYCKGCGLCVAECPTGSIVMRQEW